MEETYRSYLVGGIEELKGQTIKEVYTDKDSNQSLIVTDQGKVMLLGNVGNNENKVNCQRFLTGNEEACLWLYNQRVLTEEQYGIYKKRVAIVYEPEGLTLEGMKKLLKGYPETVQAIILKKEGLE